MLQARETDLLLGKANQYVSEISQDGVFKKLQVGTRLWILPLYEPQWCSRDPCHLTCFYTPTTGSHQVRNERAFSRMPVPGLARQAQPQPFSLTMDWPVSIRTPMQNLDLDTSCHLDPGRVMPIHLPPPPQWLHEVPTRCLTSLGKRQFHFFLLALLAALERSQRCIKWVTDV